MAAFEALRPAGARSPSQVLLLPRVLTAAADRGFVYVDDLLEDDAAALPVAIASSAVLAKKSIVANSSATRFKTRCRNGG